MANWKHSLRKLAESWRLSLRFPTGFLAENLGQGLGGGRKRVQLTIEGTRKLAIGKRAVFSKDSSGKLLAFSRNPGGKLAASLGIPTASRQLSLGFLAESYPT